MNILITGGTGYIGARLIQYLDMNSDHKVFALCRNSPQYMKDMFPSVTFYNHDLVNLDSSLDYTCSNIDVIIHLASLDEVECNINYKHACNLNITATIRLFESAIKKKVKRFIYMSTIGVYGSSPTDTVTESTITNPSNVYSITHKSAEDILLNVSKGKNINTLILRLSNSIGPPLYPSVTRWTLLLNQLCVSMVVSSSINLLSSGRQFKNFVTLNKVCCCLLFLINLGYDAVTSGVYNLGGEETMRVIDIISLLMKSGEEILGFDISLSVDKDSNYGDFEKFVFCNNKLKELGFNYNDNILSEINSLILFCKDNIADISKTLNDSATQINTI